jgi:hypothetical protein
MLTPTTLTHTIAEATAKERRREAARQRAIDGMHHELDRLAVKRSARFTRLAAVASLLGL